MGADGSSRDLFSFVVDDLIDAVLYLFSGFARDITRHSTYAEISLTSFSHDTHSLS